jgi:formamidopyrimidine-DNA glycosylase
VPELPEVEVTRRLLEPKVVGRTIERVVCTKPSYFFLTPPRELRRRLPGRSVLSLERRGKYLIMDLGHDQRLLLHLGMTGQLFVEGSASPRLLTLARSAAMPTARDPHLHLSLDFADGAPGLRFRDVRKFGKVRLIEPGQSDARLDKLGHDALEVTGLLLFDASRKRRIPIKTLLLDQRVLAGCGNIYADEALFASGVRPMRRAARVTLRECELIAENLRRVLLRSIETGGSSISDYVTPDGSDGAFQHERRVYARTGEPCLSCARPIERVLVGQRSSHYCRSCQR